MGNMRNSNRRNILSNLQFADNVVLLIENVTETEKMINELNKESEKVYTNLKLNMEWQTYDKTALHEKVKIYGKGQL